MFLELLQPAANGRAIFSQPSYPEPDRAFQALPINLSADEIREMVLDVMG